MTTSTRFLARALFLTLAVACTTGSGSRRDASGAETATSTAETASPVDTAVTGDAPLAPTDGLGDLGPEPLEVSHVPQDTDVASSDPGAVDPGPPSIDSETPSVDTGPDAVVLEKIGVVATQKGADSVDCASEGPNVIIKPTVDLETVVITSPPYVASTGGLVGYAARGPGVPGAYNGINIVFPKSLGADFALGDRVSVTGTYKEFYCLTQINAIAFTKEAGTEPVGAPAALTPGPIDESFEGVLVSFKNVKVTNANPDAPEDFGNVEVTGGVLVGNLFDLPYLTKGAGERNVGDELPLLTGVVTQAFGKLRVMPRQAADLLVTTKGDADKDGVWNSKDNCPDKANPAQEDADNDGLGDACDGAIDPSGPDTDVVITELLYNPTSSADDEEFVELFNQGALKVSLGGWSFSAFTYTFPLDAVIGPGEVLVVCAKASLYAGLTVKLYQWGAGGLLNTGETVTLKNKAGVAVDVVSYKPGSGWPAGADGQGASLELISTSLDNALPSSWKASSAIGGSPGVFPNP